MPKVVIVDGLSSGKHIAKYLHEAGCELLHIASRSDIADYFYRGFKRDLYTKLIDHTELESTLSTLRLFRPDYILAGSENGVLLADILNDRFGLTYSNDFSTTDCRRNKFKMIDKLHQEKIPAAEQISVQNWSELESWLNTRNCYPVVLKPLHSAGSDGVFVCADLEACRRAFHSLMGQKNKLNLMNDFVLAQEFLDGIEYVVNTVSREGRVLLTEIVQYKKQLLPNGSIVYDVDMLLPSDHSVAEQLFTYAKRVLIALGIKNGPAHAEVMLTRSGPKLVEIAARSDGILRQDVGEKTTQLGQLKATALSITDPQKFFQLCDVGGYRLAASTYNVCLIAPEEGLFNSATLKQHLAQMPSYYDASFYVDENSPIKKTQDVFSQPGTVYLIHPDREVLDRDCAEIRRLEKAGVYLDRVPVEDKNIKKKSPIEPDKIGFFAVSSATAVSSVTAVSSATASSTTAATSLLPPSVPRP